MSKQAEQRALEAYPYQRATHFPDGFQEFDRNSVPRTIFQEGYARAEKDLALTWEDIAKIDSLILEVNNEFAVNYSKEISRQKFYAEVLNRFNKSKEDKK